MTTQGRLSRAEGSLTSREGDRVDGVHAFEPARGRVGPWIDIPYRPYERGLSLPDVIRDSAARGTWHQPRRVGGLSDAQAAVRDHDGGQGRIALAYGGVPPYSSGSLH